MRTQLSYVEALALAREAAPRVGTECISLAAALGRVAARAIRAPFDLPGFANSAMDGFAIRSVDLPREGESPKPFPLRGELLAGVMAPPALGSGEAAAIMTGAMMPAGADAVVIREDARIEGDAVWLPGGIRPGANVRAADDDMRAGDPAIAAGERLTPARLSLLAALGLRSIEVAARPRVAVMTTGDELLMPGEPPQPGRRYDSNSILLASMLAEAGAEVTACQTCGDDPERLASLLSRLAKDADLVLTSGGVSAGAADHLPSVAAHLGRVVFWKVRMKPGMPVLCARIGRSLLLGLPGNPVSAGVVFRVIVEPVLDAMTGSHDRADEGQAMLSTRWWKAHRRLEFLRVRLRAGSNGIWQADPLPHQGSGALSRLAQADGLAVLEEGARDYAAGERVPILRLRGCR